MILGNISHKIIIKKDEGDIKLYPDSIYEKIKRNDILNIGFKNLKLKVQSQIQGEQVLGYSKKNR